MQSVRSKLKKDLSKNWALTILCHAQRSTFTKHHKSALSLLAVLICRTIKWTRLEKASKRRLSPTSNVALLAATGEVTCS